MRFLISGGQEKPKAGKAKDADRIKVTRYLLWTLIGTIVAHIATTAFFSATNNAEAVKAMAAVFNVWVPVLSSLVGAAVAWYFTKET